jgi:hypothetical protein
MLCLALFMRDTTNSFEKMMRFPTKPFSIEQNYKLWSENALDASSHISNIELDPNQAAVSQHKNIASTKYDLKRRYNDYGTDEHLSRCHKGENKSEN